MDAEIHHKSTGAIVKQRIEELATAAYAEWVNVTCVGDCSEKYSEIIGKAITTAVNEALEMAASECERKADHNVDWAEKHLEPEGQNGHLVLSY